MTAPVSPVPAPTLVVEDLSIEFLGEGGWMPVVDHVSLAVGQGETVGLVGESGSGKTVTCLTVMQLLPVHTARVSAGSIRLGGTELIGRSRRELEDVRGRDVAMIFQDPMTSLDPVFTIGDQIAEVVRRHRGGTRKAAMARALEMLDAVGMPSARQRLRSYPHELSGGMRQRVMIAMALSCEPSLLIADEPTTALDVTVQAQVLDVIRSMSAELGTAVLFVTHDLGVVADLCDRVVVMYAGQVVETAKADDAFERPRHPYSAALLQAMPQVGAGRSRLATIPGMAPRAGSFPDGCRFHPRCAYAIDRCATGEIALVVDADSSSSRCLRRDELVLVDELPELRAGSATEAMSGIRR